MRTWILSEKGFDVRVKPENECSFADETLYRVVELEPVLDLLERWAKWLNKEPWDRGERVHRIWWDTQALLRAHGRLDG